jgi:hypothetical protein
VDESYLCVFGRFGFSGLFQRGDKYWNILFGGHLGAMDNTRDEFIEIYHGLRLVKEMRYAKILCYCNYQIVIDLILKDYNTFHY